MKNREAIEILVDCGIKELNFYVNSAGHNPLTYAASIGLFEFVDYLS